MHSIRHEHDIFITSDLALAAALALFAPLDAVIRHHHPVQFVFRRDPDLDAQVEQYWRGALMVEPQAYVQQLGLMQDYLDRESID